MKSRGLFPGPSSRPKRSFASAAGNSEYKHVLPDTDGYQGRRHRLESRTLRRRHQRQ